MASKSTPPETSEPTTNLSFNIFQDKAWSSSAAFANANNENTESSRTELNQPVLKTGNESTAKDETTLPVDRAPLADVTREAITRSRSFSSALAEIARLKEKLRVCKGENRKLKAKNRNLKGEIVAYQDALYQADVDAGYL